MREGELPVFWACGVTPQLALAAARPEIAMTHSPGCMFVTNDGSLRSYSFRALRDHCPCATCREKRSQPPPPPNLLTVLSPADTRPLTLVEMKPVGHYAYTIRFSDGHDTGIYTFELLWELGRTS